MSTWQRDAVALLLEAACRLQAEGEACHQRLLKHIPPCYAACGHWTGFPKAQTAAHAEEDVVHERGGQEHMHDAQRAVDHGHQHQQPEEHEVDQAPSEHDRKKPSRRKKRKTRR